MSSNASGQTPFQRLIREMNLRPPLEGEELRRVQEELEQMKRDRPELYRALVESKARLEKLAEAMYPSEEEHRRLLATEHPSDQPDYVPEATAIRNSGIVRATPVQMAPMRSLPVCSTPVRSDLARRGISAIKTAGWGAYERIQWIVVGLFETAWAALLPTTTPDRRSIGSVVLSGIAVLATFLIYQTWSAGQTIETMNALFVEAQSSAGETPLVVGNSQLTALVKVRRRWAGGMTFISGQVICVDVRASCVSPHSVNRLTLLDGADSVLAAVWIVGASDSVRFGMSLADYSAIRGTHIEVAR